LLKVGKISTRIHIKEKICSIYDIKILKGRYWCNASAGKE
jgi:hypothetical protein